MIIEILIFILCSILSGIFSGMFGLGGGAVLVPMLIFVLPMFGVEQYVLHIAVATSLVCVVFTSVSSSLSHFKHDGVDFSVLRFWAPLNTIGATFGAFWTTGVDDYVIRLIYIIVMVVLCFYKLFNPSKVLFERENMNRFGLIFPAVFGWLSACIGIGGGNNVMALNLHGMGLKRAIGTSAVLGIFVSVPAVIVYIYTGLKMDINSVYNIGFINWLVLIGIIPISTLMAPFGVKLAYKIDDELLTIFWCAISLILVLYMITGLV